MEVKRDMKREISRRDDVSSIEIADRKALKTLEEHRKIYLISEPGYKRECLQ